MIFLLKQWKYVLLITFAIVIYFLFSANQKKDSEIDRKTENIEVLNSDLQTYKSSFNTGLKTIKCKDSIILLNAAKIASLTYTVNELKQFSALDVNTIKELKLKLKNVQSITNIGTQTDTSINTKIVYVDSTQCLDFKDEYTSVSGCFKGDSINLLIQTRDSLTTVASRVPKYKLLWWTWGVKGIQLDIRAKNPNTTFTYLKYIELKK